MVAKVLDIYLEERLIAERKALGIDKFDEVWDGVYVMSPLANDEHQRIAGFLNIVIGMLIQFTGRGEVRQGINLSDRPDDWTHNYRIPDVVVFLKGGKGICHDTFWTGGPDFVTEVVSPGEEPEDKFDFYGGLGTRELLLVHRDPWRLELYGPEANTMKLLQTANVNESRISSAVLELMFSLSGDVEDPEFKILHADGRSWTL